MGLRWPQRGPETEPDMAEGEAPPCCKCGMADVSPIINITLKLHGRAIERAFCPPCWQEAMSLNDEEIEEYVAFRRQYAQEIAQGRKFRYGIVSEDERR